MIRNLAIGFAILLTISGCAYLQEVYESNPDYSSGQDPYEKIQFTGQFATSQERARCEAAGGTVRRDGMRGWEQCIQTYADAGKTCSDNAECIGQCRLALEDAMPDTNASVTGTCQSTDSPFGCYATVEDGKATPAICVD